MWAIVNKEDTCIISFTDVQHTKKTLTRQSQTIDKKKKRFQILHPGDFC